MGKIQTEMVKRKAKDLKPDFNQPRKVFDEESIELLAETYKTQGIINPIEIDENNMIITGEMRWRAAKEAGLEEIECRLINGLSEIEKIERQVIENEHLHRLTSIERENVIYNLWNSGKYKTKKELANILGINSSTISYLIGGKKSREKLRAKNIPTDGISTTTLTTIIGLKSSEQEKVINKIIKGEIESGKLLEYVQTIKKLPSDLKEEVLKIDSKISPELALTIAEFSSPEKRGEIINEIKKTHKVLEEDIEYIFDVAKGERKAEIKFIDTIYTKVEIFQNIAFRVFNRIIAESIGVLPRSAKDTCIRLMQEMVSHLNRELEKLNRIIIIKKEANLIENE